MNKLSQEVIAGNRSALARAITLVESTLAEHQQEAQSIIQDILPIADNLVYSITGVPEWVKYIYRSLEAPYSTRY